MDTNPYESPKMPTSPAPTRDILARRSFAAMMILLFTPVAVAIAVGTTCSVVSDSLILRMLVYFQDVNSVYVAAWSIVLIPPALVFIGMLCWAVRTWNSSIED